MKKKIALPREKLRERIHQMQWIWKVQCEARLVGGLQTSVAVTSAALFWLLWGVFLDTFIPLLLRTMYKAEHSSYVWPRCAGSKCKGNRTEKSATCLFRVLTSKSVWKIMPLDFFYVFTCNQARYHFCYLWHLANTLALIHNKYKQCKETETHKWQWLGPFFFRFITGKPNRSHIFLSLIHFWFTFLLDTGWTTSIVSLSFCLFD